VLVSSRFEHFADSPTLTYDGATLIYAAGPSEELLAKFAVHRSPEVRSLAAWRMRLDPATAQRFAADSLVVRRALAHNATLSDDIRLRLAEDPAWEVRAAVAKSLHTQSVVLDRLASDSDSRVRHALCVNPHLRTMPALLERFLRSDEEELLTTALRIVDLRPEIETRHLRSDSAAVRRALARNRTLRQESQLHLAADLDLLVRLALAANPAITPTAQEKLLTGPHPQFGARKVLSVLAANPALAPEVAELLRRPDILRTVGPRNYTPGPPGQPRQ
jgi:hypothetical protein